MNDEAVREKLVAAVREAFNKPGVGGSRDVADALLPVVREIAAEELRAVARQIERTPCLRGVTPPPEQAIRDRADALTKPPDGPVR